MKTALFITKLVVEEHPIGNGNDIEYYRSLGVTDLPVRIKGTDLVTSPLTTAPNEKLYAPVHQINHMNEHGHKTEKFIAYTKDVQDLLEMPLDVYKKENDMLKAQLSTMEESLRCYHNQPWYKRVWLALQGRVL